ncbi:MAG: 5-formyltetrahydrofolate cyclo-ligase [Planctomycetaceae bacterium]|jgi:5-formyltetrahydrofolate cyclo-ligase|nr:5-formyltetrahydrofolate cyclo-ligase [Planctomycetaceae bacterium]
MTIGKINEEKPKKASTSLKLPEQPKSLLRRMVREKLIAHSSENEPFSLMICNRLNQLDAFQIARQNNRLMIYLSFGNEVQTTSFLNVYPVVVPCCDENTIVPVRIFSRNDLESGRFGILEPKQKIRNNPKYHVTPEQLDVVFVPGLAFDTLGNRLGRGKGYYDRFLSQFPLNTLLIGLAFECQIVEQIPVDTWDCPVSIVVTEKRIICPDSENVRDIRQRAKIT